MQRVKYTCFLFVLAVFLNMEFLPAQNRQVDSLVRLGDSLHARYRFEEACGAYREAMDILGDGAADPTLLETVAGKLLLSENGVGMAEFAYTPKVLDRRKFSIDDFFLYYPLPDKSWRMLPNQLDSSDVSGVSKALYAPSDASEIYFSAEDPAGYRKIHVTELEDTVWTYPSILDESNVSISDEIFPMVSDDGRSLYFSSSRLYGVGGYDLYVSRWDDDLGGWGEPVNMGFPYSSPYDDFLYFEDESEGCVFFASGRECSPDSVWVYVIEYDSMPVRHRAEDPEQLYRMSLMSPDDGDESDGASEDPMPESISKDRYMAKMVQVRALRDSVSYYTALLDEERNRFALSNDDVERMRLAGLIRDREARVPQLQDSLKRTISELQEIEMEFLFSGIAVDPDKIMAAATDDHDDGSQGYAFVRRSFGESLHLDMMKPETGFDYSFMVLDEGRFAEDSTIPDGIVYQIQIFSAGGKADVSSLKGLSPVFERRGESGRYTYRVGLFASYADVLSKLDVVRGRGFRNAFIVAYDDGEEISVARARDMEVSGPVEADLYEVRIIPSEGVLDESVTSAIRQRVPEKDIARMESEDGTIIYVIGPFGAREQADSLAGFIRDMGISEVFSEAIANDAVNQ